MPTTEKTCSEGKCFECSNGALDDVQAAGEAVGDVDQAVGCNDQVVELDACAAGGWVGHEVGDFAGPGKPMSVCVKTHDVELLADVGIDADNSLPGTVRGQAYLGSHRDYIVDVGQDVLIAAPAELSVPDGSKVRVRFKAERCRGLATN